jgi:hypothetical protein
MPSRSNRPAQPRQRRGSLSAHEHTHGSRAARPHIARGIDACAKVRALTVAEVNRVNTKPRATAAEAGRRAMAAG